MASAGGAGDNVAIVAVRENDMARQTKPLGPSVEARIRGCLFGGAVGDALGAFVEFMSMAEIKAQFGLTGAADYSPSYGRRGAITDDTQMTLFTAEGILRSYVRGALRGVSPARDYLVP